VRTLRTKLVVFFVLLSFSVFLLQAAFRFLKIPSFLSYLLALLLLIPLGWLLSRRILRSIQAITDLANRYAAGDFEQRIPAAPEDELARLGRAIEEMGIELRRRIEEISTEKDHLHTVLTGMAEGVLVLDRKGRIVVANEALQKTLGFPFPVSERTALEVIRNVDLEEAVQKVLSEGGRKTLELTLPAFDGRTLEVNVVGIPPSPPQSTPSSEKTSGIIAVFHDITRLKDLEKVRQDFVANVSHELRTPLTTIKGYSETLLDGALQEDVAFQFVQIIKKHADRLEKIVEDLLTLSKIEARNFSLRREQLSIGEVIEDVLELLREPAEKKAITLSKGEIGPALFFSGERGYLEQILVNLLDNAVKYGRHGGFVRISATEKSLGEIQVSVADDGEGIPMEDLSRIFERFYRVDKGRSKELGGTGLGLSIVKHLVQAHGGGVWAESQPGKGSTFYFTLPSRKETGMTNPS
jgi:two-component system, OmpR family, phosphate regulon sensor histidine kinase PhoR